MKIGKRPARILLYEQVVEDLCLLIDRGDFEPGDQLPSERELIEKLNVSRNVLREAFHVLESRGVIAVSYTHLLSKPLDFYMERGQKIALIGTNGIGKTTLLKSLLGLIPPLSGSCEQGENLQIGYFEQEVKGENPNSCIEEIWEEFPGFTQYEVRSALAKCGLTTKHIESKVRVLSGGEDVYKRQNYDFLQFYFKEIFLNKL